MASRYYPAVAAPNALVTGRAAGTWARQALQGRSWSPVKDTYRCKTVKANSGNQTNHVCRTNQQGDFDVFFLRWKTPPLEAITLSGTFQLCFGVQARWEDDIDPDTNDSIVRYKIHQYITVGQTSAVRHTLLDNYVDSVNFPGTTGQVWRSLAAAQTLTSGALLAGDCVMTEIGFRVVSSPTPAATYPPVNFTRIDFRGTGVNSGFADAVAGDTSTSRAPWFEWSATLTEQAAPSPPANDACADAIVITSFPYQSDFIDTSQSADTNRGAWWSFVAPTTGVMLFEVFGSNYACEIDVQSTACGGFNGGENLLNPSFEFAAGRCYGIEAANVVAGTTYRVRVQNLPGGHANYAVDSGGMCRLHAFYRQSPPQTDDLFLPVGHLVVVLREGVVVDVSDSIANVRPLSGVAIDYTKRSMASFQIGGTNVNERLLVGSFGSDLVEILDLPSLATTWIDSPEVDFFSDPWVGANDARHPAQIICTAAGILHVGFFGDGFLYVIGVGTLPAIMNTVSSVTTQRDLRIIDAINGDFQPAAPFTALVRSPTIEITAPWAITLDEATGILYYTSGGFYEPVGGQIIKRFNVTTNTQLADFATIPLQGVNNPGLKGLQFLSNANGGGGLLVCNGTVVHRLDTSGAIITTYTPSIADDSQSLCDVKLTADGLSFWTIDEDSTRIFRFTLASGVETLTVQPYQTPGALTQMAIYQPSGFAAPLPSTPRYIRRWLRRGPVVSAA